MILLIFMAYSSMGSTVTISCEGIAQRRRGTSAFNLFSSFINLSAFDTSLNN